MFLPATITLQPGDSGEFVTELQRRLASIKLYSETNIHGHYDGITTDAVRNFQFQQGLHADGIAGPETIRRLNGMASGGTWGHTNTAPTPDPHANFMRTDAVLRGEVPEVFPSDATFEFGIAPVAATAEKPVKLTESAPELANLKAAEQPLVREFTPANATPNIAPKEIPAPPKEQAPALTPEMIQALVEKTMPRDVAPHAPVEPQQVASEIARTAMPTPVEKSVAPSGDMLRTTSPQTPIVPVAPAIVAAVETVKQPTIAAVNAPLTPPVQAPAATMPPAPPVHDTLHAPLETQVLAPATKNPLPPRDAHAITTETISAAPTLRETPPPPTRNEELRPLSVSNALQRLIDYIESKLPPAVIREVKEAGEIMAARGMQQARLPDNAALPSPDTTPARAAAAPNRGASA